jgi:hypothetical protein
MQKFTFILIFSLCFLFTAQAAEDWEKELKDFRLSPSMEFSEEHTNPLGVVKHPGDNDFDLFWDNFMSGDTIADDVNSVFATADLDGDGFAEILCNDDDGWTHVFENTGDNTYSRVWSMQESVTSGHLYSSVIVTDMDGDGLPEIASGFYNSGDVHFYEWDGVIGSDNYTEVATLSFSQGAVRSMVVDNLDSDANQELVVCANDTMYIYEADAGFVFNQEFKAWGINSYSTYAVTTADLNNNGAKEAILGQFNYAAIYIFENTGEDTYANVLPDTVEFQLDPGEDGYSFYFAQTDLDADGFPELYSGDNNGKMIVFEMQSSTWDTSAANMRREILFDDAETDINEISVGDADEDGNMDLYFVSDDNHVYDYEFDGGDFFDPLNYTRYDLGELNGANAEAIFYVPDTDNDGEDELIVGYEGSNTFPLLYFLEHHVIPAVPALNISRNDFYFDHLWNLADVDTELVILENIGTVDMLIDSVVTSNAVFTSNISGTISSLTSDVFELYFTALDQQPHYNSTYIIYSNSSTSPDTINVGADSRPKPLLYLNEFQPKGTEWLELINGDTNPIDLTDIGFTGGRSTFAPNNLFMVPEMEDVEWLATDPNWGPTPTLNAGEILISYTTTVDMNNSQDYLYLVYPDSGVIDRAGFGAVGPVPLLYNFGGDSVTAGSAARVAYSGNQATDWTGDFDATPGLPNDCPPPALGSTIIINEIDYDENVDGQWEWVEFYNSTGSDITMNGWRFSDGDDIFTINGLTVPANGVAAWNDSTNLSMTSGDLAYIYDDTGVRLDQVGFADFNPVVEKALTGTLQRIPDGAGPNDGYDYFTSGGGVTWFDRTHTMGSLNVQIPTRTYVIFTAQVSGDANYRSFWVNGSWDSSGVYDPNWSGPMLELKNDGLFPDTSATDSIFSGIVELDVNTTYNWWVGSENSTSSFLEDGAAVTPDTSTFNYSTTCVVDPSDAGFNDWVIGVAGDSINGWNNSSDDLARNGWEWSGNFALPAGPMEYKFVVMHSWSAGYGVGGVGGGNIQYTVPNAGNYTISFNDSTDTYTITEIINEQLVTLTTPELTTAVTNEGTIGMLNSNGGSPGFNWGGAGNLLYEGGLMISTAPDHVVDAARAVIGGSSSGGLDADYQFLTNITVLADNADSTVLMTSFDDSRASLAPLADDGPNMPIGLEVNQTTYSYTDSANSGYVIYKLELTNTSGAELTGILAGAYFDWDVGTWDANTGHVDFNSVTIPGVNGGNAFNAEFAYLYDPAASNIYIGAVPLNQNYFRASRVLQQPDEVYAANFSEANKYSYMVERKGSDPYGPGGGNDDKGLIFGLGGGTGGTGTVPDTGYTLPAGGSITVGFAIVGGNDLNDFVANSTAAMQKWAELGNSITVFEFVNTGIEDEMLEIPSEFALKQNYPNPFNPSTTIKYDLKQNADVSLVIYDLLGREVKSVVNENQPAGYKKVVWNGTNNMGHKVSSGVYIYKLIAGDFVKTRKMILMK